MAVTHVTTTERLNLATATYHHARDRVAMLTMRLMAEHARDSNPDAEFIGLSTLNEETRGDQIVTSVIGGSGILEGSEAHYGHIPTLNLDDATAHVWQPYAQASAWERNDFGERFLRIDEVLALDI